MEQQHGSPGQPQPSPCHSRLPSQSVEMQAIQSRESKGELLVLKQTSKVDQMTCALLLHADAKEISW